MDGIPKIRLAITAGAAIVLAVAAYKEMRIVPETDPIAVEAAPKLIFAEAATQTEKETEKELPYSEEEVRAIAKTLAGECYDDKETDKRLVCEVILNRVSDDRWGNTVQSVLEQEGQFRGYWKQAREISENDFEVAERALSDWYANGCKALSEYLYFSAGSNRENVFRAEF